MSPTYQLPLFQATYKFYLSWHLHCQSMPKKDRFTIGQKTENLLLEILTLVVTAYNTKENLTKKELLTQANTALECVKILIRLTKDIKALEMRWYIEYEGQLQDRYC